MEGFHIKIQLSTFNKSEDPISLGLHSSREMRGWTEMAALTDRDVCMLSSALLPLSL